jgi:hypothetical protein
MKVEMENRSIDIPFAECFRVMEEWTVVSTSEK